MIESEMFGGRSSHGGNIRTVGRVLSKERAGIARSTLDGRFVDELSPGTRIERLGSEILDTRGLSRASASVGDRILPLNVINSDLGDGLGESRIIEVSRVDPLSVGSRITGRHLRSGSRLGFDSLGNLGGILERLG